MEEALQALLEDLDEIMEEHEDVGDTEVAIQMTKAVHEGFISPKPDFVLPRDFLMSTASGNRKVRSALQRFLKKAAKVAEVEGLDSPQARLAAFQNMAIESEGGSCYNDYFDYYKRPPDTSEW